MGASLWLEPNPQVQTWWEGAKAPSCLGSCRHPLTASLPHPGPVLCSESASPLEPSPHSQLAQV